MSLSLSLDPNILNGVYMSEALNDIFISNFQKDPTLTWQFFGSSTGFFRLYPGTARSIHSFFVFWFKSFITTIFCLILDYILNFVDLSLQLICHYSISDIHWVVTILALKVGSDLLTKWLYKHTCRVKQQLHITPTAYCHPLPALIMLG